VKDAPVIATLLDVDRMRSMLTVSKDWIAQNNKVVTSLYPPRRRCRHRRDRPRPF